MNKNNAADFLPLVLALSAGKTIQHRRGDTWYDTSELLFNDLLNHYRIKPEPLERWVVVEDGGFIRTWRKDKEDAEKAAEWWSDTAKVVLMREVIES